MNRPRMNRPVRIALATAGLLAVGGATVPAFAVTDVAPATSTTNILCAGSRVINTLVCVDDSVFDPVPPAPGIVPDPRPLLP